jgi:hypothetical protein
LNWAALVLNLGVGGYALRDYAIVFKAKAAQFNPDLAIIGYVLNDPETDPIQALHAHYHQPSWWQHSDVLRLVARGMYQLELWWYGDGDYYEYLHALPRKWTGVVQALADVGAQAKARHLPVVLAIFPVFAPTTGSNYPYAHLHEKVAAAAKQNGLGVIDLREAFSRHNIAELTLSPTDPHPSRLAHDLAAKALMRGLSDRGLLPKRSDGPGRGILR